MHLLDTQVTIFLAYEKLNCYATFGVTTGGTKLKMLFLVLNF